MERSDLLFARLVAMLDFIRTNPGVSVGRFAEHFGRTEKQARADLELLVEAGEGDGLLERRFWIDSDRLESAGQIHLIVAPGDLPPPKLTSEEAGLLLLGLEVVSPGLSDDEQKLLPGIVHKVAGLTDGKPEAKRGGFTQASLHALRVIRGAIEAQQTLIIDYVSSRRESRRTIEPLQLYQVEDGWIVDAWCREANGHRSFRLDRMRSLQVGPESITRPQILKRRPTKTCVLSLKPEANWRLVDLPALKVERREDALLVTLSALDDRWLIGRILWLSTDLLATDPPELLAEAKELAATGLAVWKERLA